ncbi:hypothetical protein [Pseudochelatococcus contaminans]|uniref:Uncharacterized protein n=1 Tax=Pseudochelatococcus contaminans TaxID=1538103 RepID=A0A7W6EIT8_9HYPH|nr:hypothetical protein [Pseudochelatococcus contaminans]MBB3811386.1 hypothetical protein [Pseudochelatococcus contaminans]
MSSTPCDLRLFVTLKVKPAELDSYRAAIAALGGVWRPATWALPPMSRKSF